MEKIEIRNENGTHFAYFRGVKLPALIRSTVDQGVGMITTATLEFEVDIETNKQLTFEIKESDLNSVLLNHKTNYRKDSL